MCKSIQSLCIWNGEITSWNCTHRFIHKEASLLRDAEVGRRQTCKQCFTMFGIQKSILGERSALLLLDIGILVQKDCHWQVVLRTYRSMLATPPINEVLAFSMLWSYVTLDSESLKALLSATSMFDYCQTRPTCLVGALGCTGPRQCRDWRVTRD